MSKKTVKRYVDSLLEKGFITAEPTSRFTEGGLKGNSNLLYTIRPIDEAKQLFYDRQLAAMEAAVERGEVAALLENQACDPEYKLENADDTSCQTGTDD